MSKRDTTDFSAENFRRLASGHHVPIENSARNKKTVGEATADQLQEKMASAYLEERVATLFDAIAHGSDEHRAWLKKAIDDHFAHRPVRWSCLDHHEHETEREAARCIEDRSE